MDVQLRLFRDFPGRVLFKPESVPVGPWGVGSWQHAFDAALEILAEKLSSRAVEDDRLACRFLHQT